MQALGVLVGTAVALALQTSLAQYMQRGTAAVDLVLVAVVYAGLTAGPGTGLLAGTVAGLIQDALSSGVVGVGGLAKTVVGFVAGILGTQFIVARPLPRFVVFFVATLVHATLFIGLYELLELRTFGKPYGAVTMQGLANAIVGIVVFQVLEMLPGAMERRRAARGGLHVSRRLD